MSDLFRPCLLVPTYDNPATIRSVVERARAYLEEVVVVDDGSGPAGREACEALRRDGLAHVVRRPKNGGKGAAVKSGFAAARELDYTHALQIDADGQHALEDLPEFLRIAESKPEALILGAPIFDASAPRARRIGRRITIFWVDFETGGSVIRDPMCGLRVYPLAQVADLRVSADRMDFDPEIAVRLAWRGVPIVNVPTRVRYIAREQGGVSHFRLLEDNLRIGWMHTRLCVQKIFGTLIGRRYRGRELGAGA